MEVRARKDEPFEKLMRRFKKKVLNADIINQYKTHQEFTPKSVARQARKANKLRKSREQNE
tara:strand:+ start:1461 stop:1643 length:183 start_codon:yes stop_codon:yes gene_type:complete